MIRGGFDDAEQAAFEDWLYKTRPSGDAEEVQRKWLTSHEYRDFLDEQEPFFQNAVYAAAGGMTQTAIER